MKATQCKQILTYCDTHDGCITPMEAMIYLKCMRLAARISDLEKAGYVFQHEMVYTVNDDGKTVHYMKYKKVA